MICLKNIEKLIIIERFNIKFKDQRLVIYFLDNSILNRFYECRFKIVNFKNKIIKLYYNIPIHSPHLIKTLCVTCNKNES